MKKPKPKKKDPKAPKQLTLTVGDKKQWGKAIGQLRQFDSGGMGYNFSTRIQNPENGEQYIFSGNLVLLGSKPDKTVAKKKK